LLGTLGQATNWSEQLFKVNSLLQSAHQLRRRDKMKQYVRGEIVRCPSCGELPDGEEYTAEDYFVHPIKAGAFEQIECGNCYAVIDCEVSQDGRRFLFALGDA
jgi:hypothetical protein